MTSLPIIEGTPRRLPDVYEPEASDRPTTWEERDRRYARWVAGLAESRYVDYPLSVHFETLARCNAACDFCPYPSLKRKGDRMPDALIDKIIREMGDIPGDVSFEVCPHRVNEPFLDTRIFEYVPRINETLPNARLTISTNGSPLTAAVLDKIAGFRNISYFNISFNDHRKSEYERVMQIPYEPTVANLDRLHERVAAGVLPLPAKVSRVGDGSVFDAEFISWCRDRWPAFRAISAREDWMGSMQTRTRFETPQLGCSQWFKVGFVPDGRETFCCFDAEGDHGIASIADTHLLDIYNHPERRSRRVKGLMRDQLDLCRGCQVRS